MLQLPIDQEYNTIAIHHEQTTDLRGATYSAQAFCDREISRNPKSHAKRKYRQKTGIRACGIGNAYDSVGCRSSGYAQRWRRVANIGG